MLEFEYTEESSPSLYCELYNAIRVESLKNMTFLTYISDFFENYFYTVVQSERATVPYRLLS